MKKQLFRLLVVSLLVITGCVELERDYYQVKSPEGDQTLTFVTVTNLIEPLIPESRLKSGVYLFVGAYDGSIELPLEYLKLKFTDSPLGIVWGDTIKIGYGYVEVNNIESINVQIFDHTSLDEFDIAETHYRARTGDYKTAYFLSEIFRKYEVRPD